MPIVYAIGERMADPHLTTIEAMPTVTFYGANDRPFGADRTKQKPLFIFEGHLTHGFAQRLLGLARSCSGAKAARRCRRNQSRQCAKRPFAWRHRHFRSAGERLAAPQRRQGRGAQRTWPERMDGSAPSSAPFSKGEGSMATVLERPQVSKALPPEKVKGRQSAVAIPEGGYFPDKVEQGRFGPIFPRTPLNYGFTIIAKIKPGTRGELLPVRPQYRGGRCGNAGSARRPEAPHAEMGAVRHQGRHLFHVPGHLRHRLRQIYRGRGQHLLLDRARYGVREPRRLSRRTGNRTRKRSSVSFASIIARASSNMRNIPTSPPRR